MGLFIKFGGFLLILTASTLIGFCKSLSLSERVERLKRICVSFLSLEQRIRLDGGEIDRLLKESFSGCDTLSFSEGKIVVNDSGILREDAALMYEYLAAAGMADTTAECGRAELYRSFFEERYSQADKKKKELSKLYQTVGFLGGVLVIILLL